MKKQVVVHPVLFSLFPVIFYYAYAYDFFEFPVVITPAFVSLSLALILWWVITRLTAARKRSGLIVSAIFLALFSFGAFYKSVVVQQEGTSLADQIIWIGCGMVVSAVAFFATLRRYVVQLTYLMNFFGTVLCGLSLLSVAIPGSRALLTEDPAPESRMSNLEGHIALQGVDGPDI